MFESSKRLFYAVFLKIPENFFLNFLRLHNTHKLFFSHLIFQFRPINFVPDSRAEDGINRLLNRLYSVWLRMALYGFIINSEGFCSGSLLWESALGSALGSAMGALVPCSDPLCLFPSSLWSPARSTGSLLLILSSHFSSLTSPGYFE